MFPGVRAAQVAESIRGCLATDYMSSCQLEGVLGVS